MNQHQGTILTCRFRKSSGVSPSPVSIFKPAVAFFESQKRTDGLMDIKNLEKLKS